MGYRPQRYISCSPCTEFSLFRVAYSYFFPVCLHIDSEETATGWNLQISGCNAPLGSGDAGSIKIATSRPFDFAYLFRNGLLTDERFPRSFLLSLSPLAVHRLHILQSDCTFFRYDCSFRETWWHQYLTFCCKACQTCILSHFSQEFFLFSRAARK
jgi:hypothetical protein